MVQPKFCRKCLKSVNKRNIQPGGLCSEHFKELSIETQKKLIFQTKMDHFLDGIQVAGVILCILAGILPFSIIRNNFSEIDQFYLWIRLISIGFGMMFLPPIQVDSRRKKVFWILKENHIHMRFMKDEGKFTCSSCKGLTPPKKTVKYAQPFICKICGKILCVNCYVDPGLCQQHNLAIDEPGRQIFTRLEKNDNIIETLLVVYTAIALFFLSLIIEWDLSTENHGKGMLIYISIFLLIPLTVMGILSNLFNRIEKKMSQKYLYHL